jgi:hypothetical protein
VSFIHEKPQLVTGVLFVRRYEAWPFYRLIRYLPGEERFLAGAEDDENSVRSVLRVVAFLFFLFWSETTLFFVSMRPPRALALMARPAEKSARAAVAAINDLSMLFSLV